MSSEWPTVQLSDCAEFQEGYVNPSQRNSDFFDGPIKWLRAVDLNDSVVSDTTRTLSEKGFRSAGKSALLFEPGSLAISKSGTIGRLGILEDYMCGNRAVINIRVNHSICDKHYIFYVLKSKRAEIESLATGSVQKNLYTSVLGSMELDLPPLETQKAIASQLWSLDKKIQINHQINQTLEQMAQAIFKSWFVDFEPVKVKIAALKAGGSEEDALLAAMQAISSKGEAELTRLQAEQPEQYAELRATAELFPLAMQDSELGEIPEEWEVLPLSEMVELIGGGTPKKSEPSFWNGDICWFSVKDAPKEGNVFVVDTEDKITEEGLNRSSTKLLPLGTTIITARGTVGKLALAGIPTAMNQSCYGVVGNDGTGPYLNYLRLQRAVDNLQQNTHGAVFDTITRSTFEAVNQARACLALRQRFEQLVQPLFDAIKNNVLHSDTLCATRDSLLPKLLSGELTIQEHESEFARATEV